METYTLDPLADTLTARKGIDGRTFLVLTDDGGLSWAWDIAQDPKGRDAAALLSLAWKVGAVDISKWQDADGAVPAHVHDCDRCQFLGRVDGRDAFGSSADVWLDTHNSRGESVLIVRFSSYGHDYAAMPAWCYETADGPQGRAFKLYQEKMAMV